MVCVAIGFVSKYSFAQDFYSVAHVEYVNRIWFEDPGVYMSLVTKMRNADDVMCWLSWGLRSPDSTLSIVHAFLTFSLYILTQQFFNCYKYFIIWTFLNCR